VEPERQRRLALNEVRLRDLNEQQRIAREEFRADAAAPPTTFEIVCECVRLDCEQMLVVDRDDYLRVRSDATTFMVAPGHQDGRVEDVVDRLDGYLVVRKTGEGSEVAEQLA
jgi:hypothetical protein